MHGTIVLLGPPGSGKGTQAARLQQELGYAWLSTGDLLRKARAEGTELGRSAARYMDSGDLVPDQVIVDLVRDSVADTDGPVLFDGFPRTVAQAAALDEVLAEDGRDLGAAVLIDVPDQTVMDRISGRGQGRSDDNPETVRERLRVYHDETEPVVGYYDDRGLLRRVDGCGEPDAVFARVRRSAEG
jgi:adenylate kinase